MASKLERALAQFRRGRRAAQKEGTEEGTEASSGDPFRAVVEERLHHLEQQLGEVKGRVNGLIFLVAGTALTQVIIKLIQ
jgi:flagellar biosynthesis/type III secretory pathway protein FliH